MVIGYPHTLSRALAARWCHLRSKQMTRLAVLVPLILVAQAHAGPLDNMAKSSSEAETVALFGQSLAIQCLRLIEEKVPDREITILGPCKRPDGTFSGVEKQDGKLSTKFIVSGEKTNSTDVVVTCEGDLSGYLLSIKDRNRSILRDATLNSSNRLGAGSGCVGRMGKIFFNR